MVAQKTILTISSLMAAMIFGGGIYLYMNLGSIAKIITERMASEAMGVGVTISSIDINPQEKLIKVRDIRIKNPDGYKNPYIMTVDSVQIQSGALSKELLTFDNIDVSGTDVYVEVSGATTNLHTLRDQVNEISAARNANKEPAADKETTPIKVIIRSFLMEKASLHPSVLLIQEQDLGTVAVPPVRLTGIGERENGVLAKDAIAQIARHLMKEFNTAAAQEGFLAGMSVDALRDMGLSQIGAIQNTIEDGVRNVGDKLKGLFE